jgi:hypothetical protein
MTKWAMPELLMANFFNWPAKIGLMGTRDKKLTDETIFSNQDVNGKPAVLYMEEVHLPPHYTVFRAEMFLWACNMSMPSLYGTWKVPLYSVEVCT